MIKDILKEYTVAFKELRESYVTSLDNLEYALYLVATEPDELKLRIDILDAIEMNEEK